MPIENKKEVEIEIISDEFSLEFFINGKSASFLLYPDKDSDEFIVEIESNKCTIEKSLYE